MRGMICRVRRKFRADVVYVTKVPVFFAAFVNFHFGGVFGSLPQLLVVVAAPVVLFDWGACLVLLDTFESPRSEPFPWEKRLVFTELVFTSVLGSSGHRVGDDPRLAWSGFDGEVKFREFLHPERQSWSELGGGVHAGR